MVCTDVHTIIEMAYQWNRDKAAVNLRKHGIDFADATSVFSDDLAITIPDARFDEERFVTIGVDAFGRVLVVVYTMRSNEIRIISAHKATRQERQQYEEE
ncbi:MAG: BrnT family toxin [Elainellaceae cyanobacterium]